MRTLPLALAVCFALSGISIARDTSLTSVEKSQSRGIYLVNFVEPPLASFRGDIDGQSPTFSRLKATSPAITGARRLDVSAPASLAYRAALAELREDRLSRAGARFGRVLEPLFVYDVATHGVALELTPDEALALSKVQGVRSVQPDFIRRPMTDAGPQWVNADALWDGSAGISTRGERAVVGVIDSGINRTHPSFAATGPVDAFLHVNPRPVLLGRCATPSQAGECNAKLIGIHDFTLCTGTHANSDCNDREANDGLDGTGHGTHVASTAAGNVLNASVNIGLPSGPVSRRISGVAPHANLVMYKACEDEETCRGSWLLAAINQAVADGVDVINYSIGGEPRNPWSSPDSNAMLNAREAGVVIVVAAGNKGPGTSTVTGPGDAPWVLTAANATHDRGIVNRLVDLTGGASAPPAGGILIGASSTAGYGPRPLVIDTLFPGCSQGVNLDSPPTGVSNPWSAGRFNGEIVVCNRGVQARVAKSNNVRLAGGGGMVLVNTAAEGESVIADAHSIPSTHLGFASGAALKAWMATGSGHQGRIEGAQVQNVAEFGDVLSSSSGRGPVATLGVLKPDLTAPGTSILAAAETGSGTAFLSGTSMASPHISGAIALLISARPAWTPSQVESALLTTARGSVRLQDGRTPASPFDQGAGATDVGKAAGAGLYFDITPTQFRAANPAAGGTPRDLNRPSIVHEACFERCSVTRRVSDLIGGGSWRVDVDLPSPASATVTPANFTLASGQATDITFVFDVSDASFPGRWVDGRVKFIRTDNAATPNAELALTLFSDPGSVPDKLSVSGSGESGFRDLVISGLVALPQANFTTTALVAPQVTNTTMTQDPTRDDRYDSFGPGTFASTINVPVATPGARAFKLVVDTRSATAHDVDLFVGADTDGDGAPDESEELCSSTGARDLEHCDLDIQATAAARVYWVLVQNWDAGVSGDSDTATASDIVTLETVLVATDGAGNETLTVTGPGHTATRDAFALRLIWDDPTLLPGERRVGFLRLGASNAVPGQVGMIPVEVRRAAVSVNAPAVLAPDASRRMRLMPGAAHDRLYLDVPPNASALAINSLGSGEVDLYVARASAPSSPDIASAPARGEAAATSIHPGATESVTLTGTALTPGRWYVTPVNAGSTNAEFSLSAVLQYASARPQPKYGAYFNPARSGAGLFLFPANGQWGLAWYTYLQDGTPTWYLGVATQPAAQQGVWRVAMQRYHWDGNAATGTAIGEAQLAFTDATHFSFSWNLDGESGSEPMSWLDGGACAQLNGAPAALTGLWFSPAKPGFGYSINAYPGLESNGAYFYDAQGIARWALGQTAPFGAPAMTLSQRDGFCPLCAYKVPVTQDIGSLIRRYDSGSTGNIAVNLTLRAPMQGVWNVDLPVSRLSDALQCP